MKLFRPMRFKLSKQNKLFTYLKYAIGEIVLVMIGILLALQVNNWNENNKGQNEIKKILKQVNSELEYNIKQGESSIEYYIRKDSLAERIRNVTLKTGEFNLDKDGAQISILFNSGTIIPETEAFETLIQHADANLPELDPIIRGLKEINIKLKKDMLNASERMTDISDTYRTHLVYNTDWFSTYYGYGGEKTDEAVDHFLHDPVFANNLAWYRSAMTANYSRKLRNYVHRARLLHKSIKEFLRDTTNYDFEYKPLPLENLKNYVGTYISNEYDKELKFEIINKDGIPYFSPGNFSNEMHFIQPSTFFMAQLKFKFLKDGSIFLRVSPNYFHQPRIFKKTTDN